MKTEVVIMGWVFILALMLAQYLYNRRVLREKDEELKELEREVEVLKEAVEDLKNPIEAKLRSVMRKSVDDAVFAGESSNDGAHHVFAGSMDFEMPEAKLPPYADTDVEVVKDAWDNEVIEFCNDTLRKFEEKIEKAIDKKDFLEIRKINLMLSMQLTNKISQVTSRNRSRKKVN